jgi:hypothetical protein
VVGPDPRVAPGSIGSPVRSVNGRELFPGVHVPPGQGHAGYSVHPLGCSSYSLDKPTVRSGVHVSLGQGHVGSSVHLPGCYASSLEVHAVRSGVSMDASGSFEASLVPAASMLSRPSTRLQHGITKPKIYTNDTI